MNPFLPLDLEAPPAPAAVNINTQPVTTQTDYNTYNQNSFGSGRFAYKVHDENYNNYYTV